MRSRRSSCCHFTGVYNSLNDYGCGYILAYMCEFDLVPANYTASLAVGSQVFLRGTYLEMGIHNLGSFGTPCVRPLFWVAVIAVLHVCSI